jgi:hypothetical protein
MFHLIVKGKNRRFVGGDMLGGKRIESIWLGDKKIWPSDTAARKIRVQLPERGTVEWAYWVHALDSVTNEKCSSSNYMRFTVDGMHFYLQQSPDGTPPYHVEGNFLTLDLDKDGVSADMLGDYLTVSAVISKRTKYVYSGYWESGTKTFDVDLPILDGSSVWYRQYCKRRGARSHSYITITATPSEKRLFYNYVMKASRSVKTYGGYVNASGANDTGWTYKLQISGVGRVLDPYVIYPSFSRTFKLKIISVE